MLMYCNSKQELATVGEIARFYGLSEKFLLKILHGLTSSGLMVTVRGRSGGIKLAKSADKMLLGDVIKTIEENFELAECFQSGETDCPLAMTCGLNEALSRALQGFFDILNEYTIDDLTRKKHNIHVLLKLSEAKRTPLLQ